MLPFAYNQIIAHLVSVSFALGAVGGASLDTSEKLSRGVVGVSTDDGIYLSWRMLKSEADGFSTDSLTGEPYTVYKNGEKIAVVTDSTTYCDPDGKPTDNYTIGYRDEVSEKAYVSEAEYISLPLKKPADGKTPDGKSYTYSPNDVSVGDADGDGEYEYFVKWDPSNSQDVSIVGYTGKTYIDCYKLDGELLWRIDLGCNIRSGAHYTQFTVYDFDGDGLVELMMKTAPGTVCGDGKYITMTAEDIANGYLNTDNYTMSPEDYYNHLTEMFMGWSTHPEVLNGNWTATIEESLGIKPQYDYPLSRTDAEKLADYFIDEYAVKRSNRNKLREYRGFILTGPEYLTVFDCRDGSEIETIPYDPAREDDGLMWGDYAMARIEPGNRVDRFLSCVAYLDGETPAAIFARGYYSRTVIVGYTFDGEHLTKVLNVDSGFPVMDNPFNSDPHSIPGRNPEYADFVCRGFHHMSAGDVDGDGCDEIIYGAATVDNDGSLLYISESEPIFKGFSFGMGGNNRQDEDRRNNQRPEGQPPEGGMPNGQPPEGGMPNGQPPEGGMPDGQPPEGGMPNGQPVNESRQRDDGKSNDKIPKDMQLPKMKMSHGDAMHLADINPLSDGLEIFTCHETGTPLGFALRTAADGIVKYGEFTGTDTGRCMIGDIRPDINGLETWAADKLYSAGGIELSGSVPGTNFNIKWSRDMTTQTVDTQVRGIPVINDYENGKLLVCEGTMTNNGTKGTPCLVADVVGDFCEELILRTTDGDALRIYTNTSPSDKKLYCLMQDRMYRTGVARQNTAYNQPSYTSFYHASDMLWYNVPLY